MSGMCCGDLCCSVAMVLAVQVFATFCGLGLHNVMMYEEIAKANARNKVAFDVLTYHASSNLDEAHRLMVRTPVNKETHTVSPGKRGQGREGCGRGRET